MAWSHSWSPSWSSYFWVRSAGFPFDWLEKFSVLADSPLLADYEAQFAQLQATENEVIAFLQADAPGALPKIERKFRERMAVQSRDLAENLRAFAEPLLQRRETLLTAAIHQELRLRERFDAQLQSARQWLVDRLSQPQVREALFLSNPEALERLDALAAGKLAKIDSRARQRLRLGWNYLQRLCSKNDTASFFGPIAWGRFVAPERPGIHVELSVTPWLSARKAFFEHWVVLRLEQALAADPDLRPHLPIAQNAGCHVDGNLLRYPAGKTTQLDALGMALFRMVANDQAAAAPSADKVVAGLAAAGFPKQDAATLLSFLMSSKVLSVGFCSPPGGELPLERLIGQLNQVDAPDGAKKPWIDLLHRLAGLRIEFERGDLETRAAALDAIRELLSTARIDLARSQGKMYVGRFPLYEDCARNLHVELGGSVAQIVKTQLEPLMTLYAWLVGAVAVRLHDRYLQCWQQLRTADGGVDFLSFYARLSKENHKDEVVAEVREMLRRGWAHITKDRPGSDETSDEITLSEADLAHLLGLLDASEPRAARFPVLGKEIHSPDFMLAARDVAAINAGSYEIVVGEVHPAVHTVSQPVAHPFCPYANEIRDEVQALLAPATLVVADSPESYQRSHIDWLDVPALTQVILPGGGARVPGERALPSGRGEVILRNGLLYYRDRQLGATQEILTVLPSAMHRACFALAGDLAGESEHRRLKMGRVVLKRKTWQFNGNDMPEKAEPGETLEGFLAWRRWAATHRLPRHVFVKCESEPKPVYVDFRNPLALDLLAGLAKKKEGMRFSEMRPAPDELWLADDRGSYCAEFRTSYAVPGEATAREMTAATAQEEHEAREKFAVPAMGIDTVPA